MLIIRIGRRRVIMGCSFLLFSSCLATALLSKYGSIYYLVGRMFISAWAHGAMVVTFTWIIEMACPKNRNFVLVSTMGATAVGGLIFPVFYLHVQWQLIMIILSIMFLLMVPIMFLAK